jgi:hypothetical protein
MNLQALPGFSTNTFDDVELFGNESFAGHTTTGCTLSKDAVAEVSTDPPQVKITMR